MLGDSGVGKSSLLLREVTGSFHLDHQATVGVAHLTKILSVGQWTVKLNLWDTAGQERYRAIARVYYQETDAAVLVYDITCRASFEALERWHKELRQLAPKDLGKLSSQ